MTTSAIDQLGLFGLPLCMLAGDCSTDAAMAGTVSAAGGHGAGNGILLQPQHTRGSSESNRQFEEADPGTQSGPAAATQATSSSTVQTEHVHAARIDSHEASGPTAPAKQRALPSGHASEQQPVQSPTCEPPQVLPQNGKRLGTKHAHSKLLLPNGIQAHSEEVVALLQQQGLQGAAAQAVQQHMDSNLIHSGSASTSNNGVGAKVGEGTGISMEVSGPLRVPHAALLAPAGSLGRAYSAPLADDTTLGEERYDAGSSEFARGQDASASGACTGGVRQAKQQQQGQGSQQQQQGEQYATGEEQLLSSASARDGGTGGSGNGTRTGQLLQPGMPPRHAQQASAGAHGFYPPQGPGMEAFPGGTQGGLRRNRNSFNGTLPLTHAAPHLPMHGLLHSHSGAGGGGSLPVTERGPGPAPAGVKQQADGYGGRPQHQHGPVHRGGQGGRGYHSQRFEDSNSSGYGGASSSGSRPSSRPPSRGPGGPHHGGGGGGRHAPVDFQAEAAIHQSDPSPTSDIERFLQQVCIKAHS